MVEICAENDSGRKNLLMRSQRPFPIEGYGILCSFLKTAWTEGWLDEYSEEHFLIKAIENRLESFVGKEQLVENDLNLQGMILQDGSVDTAAFNRNFCLNFSNRMRFLTEKFGKEQIRRFMTDQMSAGKANYKEDAFFQAMSEVSVLSFYTGMLPRFQAVYEPPVDEGCRKNPEASLTGTLRCRTDDGSGVEKDRVVTIQIEVKSPEFPHDRHEGEKIAIPTILLTDQGRQEVKSFCKESGSPGAETAGFYQQCGRQIYGARGRSVQFALYKLVLSGLPLQQFFGALGLDDQ